MRNDLLSSNLEYNINRPIGYSKSPLNQHHKKPSITEDTSNIIKHRVTALTIDNNQDKSRFKLTDLPIEIITNITNNLSQFEILNLIRTCSKLYNQVLPQLYQHIIIDSNFNIFNNQEFKTNGRTYINSSFNLKKFLKTYSNKIDNHLNTIKIYKLECLNLPDSINVYDYDFNIDIVNFFSKLYNLTSLIWLNNNFRFEFLYDLPNKELIHTLILNIKYCGYLKENQNSTMNRYGSNMIEDYDIDKLNFPNIINFQIKPFEDSYRLLKIINNLLINKNNSIEVCNRLKILSLSSGDLMIDNSNIGYGIEVQLRTTQYNDYLNEYTLKRMFEKSKIQYLSNLTSLSLNDLNVRSDDAKYLINSINLKNLRYLQLRGIKEVTIIRGQNSTIITFLSILAPYLINLTHLSLRFHQLVNRIPQLLYELFQNGTDLKALDLSTVFSPDLFNSISNFQNLKKLSLEIYDPIDYGLCEDLRNEYLKELQNLKLESLRINNTINTQSLINLISFQKNLKYLDIIGSKAGGAPNLGLGMIHPTIFDDWFKVQHVALLYLKLNLNLKYISINECLFQCKSNLIINPIDGLNNWFKSKVRCLSLLDS
ncbi:uncharacterized protein KGF55_000180 [Candida pseudojiufengensis]|uniref:uncharacterized protein n=1 Tax=Candida pseudojiufengensis TaxID=497109 RepID=UPI00222584E2|nr:uncharacterized protein KGF55_000180 [Candida pseudojiufengensis]KAI5966771.1 hypothetical protein KGF55_000180 [Candida pseudojiufengensis]